MKRRREGKRRSWWRCRAQRYCTGYRYIPAEYDLPPVLDRIGHNAVGISGMSQEVYEKFKAEPPTGTAAAIAEILVAMNAEVKPPLYSWSRDTDIRPRAVEDRG